MNFSPSTVVFDEADGNWCYAVLGRDGAPECSGVSVGTVAPSRLGLTKHVRHAPEVAAELKSKRLAGGPGAVSGGLLPGEKATVYPVAPSIGACPVLVVLVDFAPDLQALGVSIVASSDAAFAGYLYGSENQSAR